MQRSQARSPRMEPPDVGSPSPWESSQLFSILLGTRQGSRLKWQGAGSGEDRQPSWLWGRFLLPEPVRGLPPAPLGVWREGDPNSRTCQHLTGHNSQPQATMPGSTVGRV